MSRNFLEARKSRTGESNLPNLKTPNVLANHNIKNAQGKDVRKAIPPSQDSDRKIVTNDSDKADIE